MKLLTLSIGITMLATSMTLMAGEKTMDYQKQAEQLYLEGNFSEARREFQLALEQSPDDSQILAKLGMLSLWNNDTEQALNYLQTAYEKSSWLGRHWPLSAQLAYRLGSAYQRKDDFSDAALWYKRAAGPWAIGPLKTVKSMQQQLGSFGTSRPYQISGPNQTRLRFVMLDPLPVVEISINGRGPYSFFIDTGGAELILADELAQELQLDVYGQFAGSFAGGKKGLVKLGKLQSVTLGETTVKNLPIHILKLEGIDNIFGRRIDGAIGTSLLRHFYSSIDYTNQQLILRQISNESRAEIEQLASNATTIPFWLVEQHMMMARGHVNQLPDTLLFVDTGLANQGFLISKATQEAAGIKLDWNQAKEGMGGGGKIKSVDFMLDELTLGKGKNSISKKQVSASMSDNDLDIFKGSLGFNVGGLISHAFFKDTSLTFDFVKMRLLIQPK